MGTPREFDQKFSFIVEIQGVGRSAWTSCDGLEDEIAVMEHREGGALRAHKQAGLVSSSDIVLKRGVVQSDRDVYDWFKTVRDGLGSVMTYKRHLTIVQKDRIGIRVREWHIDSAFPIKFKGGDWDNTSNDATMEEVKLAHDGSELVTP